MRSKRFYDILLLAATAVWGSSFFVVKDLVGSINPFVLVAYRFLIAAVFVAGIAFYFKRDVFKNLWKGFVLGLTLWLVVALQAIGMIYTTASNSGFISSMCIIFVPILSVMLFGGKVRAGSIAAIVVDVIGLWFLTEGLKAVNIGDFLTLIAALVSGLHILFIDKYSKKGFDPIVLCFQQFLVAGALSLITSLVFGYSFAIGGSKTILGLAFLIALPTLFSFLIQVYAQKHIDAIRATIIYTLEPVFAAALAWTVGGEKFIPIRAFGGLLIFFGMIIADIPLKFPGGK